MRTKNTLNNYLFAILGILTGNVLSFVNRTVFIKCLSIEYLGMSGLFTNILTIFSLAELGIGNAIIIHLYKPIAEKDENNIKSLLGLYSKSYNVIGTFVIVVGLSVIPFINQIIKEGNKVNDLKIIYIIFLLNSGVSYFFSYKRAILTADQKEYIATRISSVILILQNILQILGLYYLHNYIIYLLIMLVCTLFTNIVISREANRKYPFIKGENIIKIKLQEKKEIIKNIVAMMSHKIGAVALNNTDNLIISFYLGLSWVGIYSNYLLIISTINSFIVQLFASMSASIGNLNETEDNNKIYEIYKVLLFIGYWLHGLCSICFITLINPFIKYWIGENFLLNEYIIVLISTNFYISGINKITSNYVGISKLYWKTKYKPWAEAAINLGFGIILVNVFGMAGVFAATCISVLSMSFWIDPYILYRYKFQIKIREYYMGYFTFTLAIIIAGMINYYMCSFIANIYIKIIFSLIFTNLLFWLLFHKTSEMNYLYGNIKALFLNKINRLEYVKIYAKKD